MQADISKAQERAFLSVEDILEIGIPSKTNKSYRAWSIGPIVKNSGQTAAQAIKMHFNYCVRQTPLLASSQLPDVTNEIKTAPPIGAQQTSNIGPSDVPLFQLLMQNKGRGYFYIWGWIRYDDIFQAHHEMRFCYSLKRIIGDFIHPLGVRGGFFSRTVPEPMPVPIRNVAPRPRSTQPNARRCTSREARHKKSLTPQPLKLWRMPNPPRINSNSAMQQKPACP